MAGGADIWSWSKKGTTAAGDRFLGHTQASGDGLLELLTYKSASQFSREQLGPLSHGAGRRLHAGAGPFCTRYREDAGESLSKTAGRVFMQADGEFFAVASPRAVEITRRPVTLWALSSVEHGAHPPPAVTQPAHPGLHGAPSEPARDPAKVAANGAAMFRNALGGGWDAFGAACSRAGDGVQAARGAMSAAAAAASAEEDKRQPPHPSADDGDQAANRDLIKQLDEENIMEMLKDTGDRKFCIGSDLDCGSTSFAIKKAINQGDQVDQANSGLGYTCRKGLKPESPNNDSWTVLQVGGSNAECGGFSIYGIFDGHGKAAQDISNFVKDSLPKLILKDKRFMTADMPAMLKECFFKMQSLLATADRMIRFSAQMAGTTCSVAILDHEQSKLTVAHVGGTLIVLGKYKDEGHTELEAIPLTRDHKPDLPDERARIEKNGGRVVFDGYCSHRVYAKNGRYPGLNMSRCLGDLMGHADAGCSAEPEVSERKIDAEDHVLLVCSDGVWEFIEPIEAVRIISEFPSAMAMDAAERLAKEAWDRWIKEEGGAVVDDITVILVYLQDVKRQMKGS